jgi:Uncharacterised protein family (UPF0158)
MPLPVKLNDVIEALEEGGPEHSHYLDKRTGEIVMITNEEMEAAEEDQLISEYPEWQREAVLKARELLTSEESFIEIPDQTDIDEYQIMENFCLAFENRRFGEDLHRLIKGSGDFRRFKDAITSKGIEQSWYQFRRTEFERIAIEWLEDEEIPYTREDPPDVSDKPM